MQVPRVLNRRNLVSTLLLSPITYSECFFQLESAALERQITYEQKPPAILWHIAHRLEDFDLMTVSENKICIIK